LILPAAKRAAILPTSDRLYTIVGPPNAASSLLPYRPRTIADPRHRRDAEIQLPGGHAGMNAPVPRILIESTWRGRLFGAQWRPAIGGSLDVLEPATGAVITRVGNATAEDVRQAAAEARAAQQGWAATPYDQRAAILRKVAALMEENQPELVYWIMRETGGIEAKAAFEVQMVTSILHRSAAMCTEPQGLVLPSDGGRISLARRVPRGVIGIISPFNFPLILSSRAVAPALATGNAVVLKPDPRTALTGGFIIARLFEEAGLPKGVLQVLPGGAEAGEAICIDPDIAMVSFTGSSGVGRRLSQCVRRLVPPGPDLHDHRPRHRARENRRCADRKAGGQGEAPSRGRPDLGAGGARAGDQPQPGRPHPRDRQGHGGGGCDA
jgi:hypothetical protein